MTRMSRWIEGSARERARDDRGVAMLSVLLLMLVMTVLSLVVLGVVLTQVNPTLFTDKNARTLAAAQAGLDASTSQIRNATSPDKTGAIMGDIHKLPCTVEGAVESTGGETRYFAEVAYYVEDPEGEDDQWREDNALTCYTGTGINGGVRSVPRFAIITSEGFDDASTTQVGKADRVMEATYTFQLTTRKLAGGMILDDNGQYCLVVDSEAEYSYIRYQSATSTACQEQNDLNSWTWADDYMIHLSSTDLDGKIPLCLSGRASSGTTSMRLRECTTSSTDPLGQRFSWTGDHTWRGQNSSNTGYANSYIVNQDSNVSSGDRLSVSTSPNNKSLTPLPAVGKGNASYETDQVVNYNQFGRCLDVTNANIYASYQIAYPCKQDPSGNGGFLWNHKWYYEEPGSGANSISTQIQVRTGGNTYCLITTSTTGVRYGDRFGLSNGSYNTDRYPRFLTPSGYIDCGSSTTWWTRYGASHDETQSYTFQDSNGRCLSAGGPKTSAHPQWTTITVETCDGSDDQKWNVPDVPVTASLSGFVETTGRGDG